MRLGHGARILSWAMPVLAFAGALLAWDLVVRLNGIPPFILPAPALVAATLVSDWPILSASLWVTLRTTLEALVVATAGGVALAVVFAQSRWIALSFYPFAVILQVTPIIAIAPLLLIYLSPDAAVLTCAFVVAFFPVLSNTLAGLTSVDPNLRDLFRLNRASRLAELLRLRIPAALPSFLVGLRIAGGLALIGAIVAEIAAGSSGQGSGLAYRIVEAGYRLNVPRMFAALALISIAGVVIYGSLALLSHVLLRRWHDSTVARDG
ncbi:ABC transporter permease [Chelatococcus reniformis]|uniref:ABC transporter permease n=1 Tax=Chelatococcus reniformis TaxID=1494448 RepID=A0A916XE35_9HYPH|nr:ABC transporter permease [Chelatococcus reniformis]GGC63719.1 ABC transporter permease [Chelatococcus reniformis]